MKATIRFMIMLIIRRFWIYVLTACVALLHTAIGLGKVFWNMRHEAKPVAQEMLARFLVDEVLAWSIFVIEMAIHICIVELLLLGLRPSDDKNSIAWMNRVKTLVVVLILYSAIPDYFDWDDSLKLAYYVTLALGKSKMLNYCCAMNLGLMNSTLTVDFSKSHDGHSMNCWTEYWEQTSPPWISNRVPPGLFNPLPSLHKFACSTANHVTESFVL